jgi:hypothetical protein
MIRAFLIFVLVAISLQISAQICVHPDLSEKYEYKVNMRRYPYKHKEGDSCAVRLFISDKKTSKVVQKISFSSLFYFKDVFVNCDHARSYITNKNIDKDATQNDWGDIIIADLNFDDREDIAIKNNSGGSSGATYSFYFQNAKGVFEINTHFAELIEFFPSEINKSKMTLTTVSHRYASHDCKTVYQYDLKKRSWTMINESLHSTK